MALLNPEKMVVLNSEISETEENNGSISYRRRPRKSTSPQVSPFNSIQDLYRFPPKNNVRKLKKSNQANGIKHMGSAGNISFPNNLDHCRGKRSFKNDIASKRFRKRRPDSEVNKGRAKRAKLDSLNHVGSARNIILPKKLDSQERRSSKKVSAPIKYSNKGVLSGVDEGRARTANLNGGRNVNHHLPLPEKFMRKMRELGYTGNPVLVIQKELYASDVDGGKQRLSIPVKQVENEDFLTIEEKSMLNNRDQNEAIESILIDHELREWEINFKKWFMSKSGQYVLISPWNDVVRENQLKAGMHVQVWSFRMNRQLYFVLVKLS